MKQKDTEASTYALGHSEEELERLGRQAQAFFLGIQHKQICSGVLARHKRMGSNLSSKRGIPRRRPPDVR